MGGIVSLEKAGAIADRDAIWDARGKAIQAYATLEQSLCLLFAHLGNLSQDVAPLIFFKITSQDVRNKIIEKLMKLKYGDKYNLFSNSLFAQLRPIDIQRNCIVHWHALQTVGANDAGETTCVVSLKPPAALRMGQMDEFLNAP